MKRWLFTIVRPENSIRRGGLRSTKGHLDSGGPKRGWMGLAIRGMQGGALKHAGPVVQAKPLKNRNRAEEEERTEQGSSESEQQHPGSPRGRGGHSDRDSIPP